MPARRTTNQMKVLRGTDRKDRIRNEPEFPEVRPDQIPDPPDWLLDHEAVKEWNHKVGLLTRAGVLTEAALSQLAQYCNMHASAVKQWRAGVPPTAADLTQLRLMATEFGFTPASMSKVGKPSKGKGNPFKELAG